MKSRADRPSDAKLAVLLGLLVVLCVLACPAEYYGWAAIHERAWDDEIASLPTVQGMRETNRYCNAWAVMDASPTCTVGFEIEPIQNELDSDYIALLEAEGWAEIDRVHNPGTGDWTDFSLDCILLRRTSPAIVDQMSVAIVVDSNDADGKTKQNLSVEIYNGGMCRDVFK